MPGKFDVSVYKQKKAKEAYASKTWEPTKGDKIALGIITPILVLTVVAVLAVWMLPVDIPILVKIPFTILAGVAFFIIIAVFLLITVLKHNKKDPMEMHYYDVDYKVNNLSGEVYDNTKEITKEEFFAKGNAAGEKNEN